MKHRLATTLLALLPLTLTEAATHAMQAPRAASTSATQDKGSKMDDLKPFATGGRTILESRVGDIRGDGSEGVVLVLDPPVAGAPKLGEGPAREVMLLVRDDHGRLHKVASNSASFLVPAVVAYRATRTDIHVSSEDTSPSSLAVAAASTGRMNSPSPTRPIATIGSSPAPCAAWNRDTGQQKQLDLPAKDIGKIAFEDFDPAKLPEVELP